MSTRVEQPAGWLRTTWVRHRDFLRFVVAAGASVPVNIAARVMFSQWMPYGYAVLASHLVGMITAYVLTRLFVFAPSGRSVASELSRFALVNVVSAGLTWAISVGLVDVVFPRIGYTYHAELVAHVIGLGTASITSFIGHSRFSFRHST